MCQVDSLHNGVVHFLRNPPRKTHQGQKESRRSNPLGQGVSAHVRWSLAFQGSHRVANQVCGFERSPDPDAIGEGRSRSPQDVGHFVSNLSIYREFLFFHLLDV